MSETNAMTGLAHKLLTVLQALASILLALITMGAALAVLMLNNGSAVPGGGPAAGLPVMLAGSAGAVCVCACCYVAIIGFILLCQQLKQGRTFSDLSCKWLGRIAVSMGVGAVVTLTGALCSLPLVPVNDLTAMLIRHPASVAELLPRLPVYLGAMTFAFLGVALIARVLQLMCRRAMELQDENDLTI